MHDAGLVTVTLYGVIILAVLYMHDAGLVTVTLYGVITDSAMHDAGPMAARNSSSSRDDRVASGVLLSQWAL